MHLVDLFKHLVDNTIDIV